MEILLHRHNVGKVACDGTICIDGCYVCDSTEPTAFRAPAGEYSIELSYHQEYVRKVPHLKGRSPGTCLAIGNGIYHRNDGRILVGTYIAPGCLHSSHNAFLRIYNRINIAQRRGHNVILKITES